MTRWIDATLPISNDALVWPGDDPIDIAPTCQISQGEVCNESRIQIGSHNTTHIDAPYHFDPQGKRIDEVAVDVFVGPAWVLQVDAPDLIRRADVQRIPEGKFERVLFKTRNTAIRGDGTVHTDYVGLEPEGAAYLVEQGCKLVGIDYYSICPYADLETTHKTLLCNDVAILESVVLAEVEPGPIEIIALPLKIAGGDACPARVLIRGRGA
jgi:arylformamidase